VRFEHESLNNQHIISTFVGLTEVLGTNRFFWGKYRVGTHTRRC